MSQQLVHRRVVVTGLGVVSALGVGWQHVWRKLINGDCGITKLSQTEYTDIPCRVAGCVPRGESEGELHMDAYIPRSDQRTMSLASQYALVAAQLAFSDAQWKPETEQQRHRTGVAVGMGMVGLDEIVECGMALKQRGYRRVNPHFIPKILINMAAGHISLKYGLQGPNHSVSTACTTGVHAIGDASRFIRYGDADVMLCGGAEASISPLGLAGFARMRALSTQFNEEPEKSSRPFDVRRDGFVMGEGAGVMVLEELSHAMSRGATIYGEILGYGLSGDAHHVTAPCRDGGGAHRCMGNAICNANLNMNAVGYVNAHATSTPLGDAAECRAVRRLFQNRTPEMPAISSTKGAVGHLLGAAGAVEAIFTTLACFSGSIPPTLNCFEADEEFRDLNLVPLKLQSWETDRKRIALTNSFGFGGTNASLCIGQYIS